MLSPYVPPQDDTPKSIEATRGVVWVVQAAVALTVIAAWVVIMLHVLLVVRAEFKLKALLDQASVFAELPEVNRGELSRFVQDRTQDAGWSGAAVTITPDKQRPGAWQAKSIRVPASQMVPPSLQWIAEQCGAPRQLTIESNDAQQAFFLGPSASCTAMLSRGGK